MTCSTLDIALTKFRENYTSVRVTQFSDCLVYKCAYGKAFDAAKSANKLIETMELPLVAIPNKFPSNNSYTILSNEIDM